MNNTVAYFTVDYAIMLTTTVLLDMENSSLRAREIILMRPVSQRKLCHEIWWSFLSTGSPLMEGY
jgi:hypothetical protein